MTPPPAGTAPKDKNRHEGGPERDVTAPVPKKTPWQILVVEDNPDHGWMLQKSLSGGLPCEVTVVRTAREAQERLAAGTFDAIVLDNRLPDAEGSRIVEEIRNDGFHGVLLLVTAQSAEDVVAKALDAGATDFVIKNRGYTDRVIQELEAHLARSEAS